MRNILLALMMLAAASTGGCAWMTRDSGQPYVSPDRESRGLVIVLTGIEGRSAFNQAIRDGLAEGGVNCSIELKDWTSIWPAVVNQRSEARNRDKAAEIADEIIDYKYQHPRNPVYLVGQSGGAAIAAWIAEAVLPPHYIDGIVMLDASLSPDYPLDTALMHTRQGIISFYSGRDWVLLGLGTTLAGTMDGEHTSAAGRMGFRQPPGGVHAMHYRKLYQIAWQSSMESSGNYGLHLTSGAKGFVCDYVAPFIRSRTWDQELVVRIANQADPDPATRKAASAAKSSPPHGG